MPRSTDTSGPALVPQPHGGALRPWLPGQSGNPAGGSAATRAAIRLAREATPRAMSTLISLMSDPSEDTRAQIVAAVHVLDRALGRPKDAPKDDAVQRFDLSRLSAKQIAALREALMAGIVRPDDDHGQ